MTCGRADRMSYVCSCARSHLSFTCGDSIDRSMFGILSDAAGEKDNKRFDVHSQSCSTHSCPSIDRLQLMRLWTADSATTRLEYDRYRQCLHHDLTRSALDFHLTRNTRPRHSSSFNAHIPLVRDSTRQEKTAQPCQSVQLSSCLPVAPCLDQYLSYSSLSSPYPSSSYPSLRASARMPCCCRTCRASSSPRSVSDTSSPHSKHCDVRSPCTSTLTSLSIIACTVCVACNRVR